MKIALCLLLASTIVSAQTAGNTPSTTSPAATSASATTPPAPSDPAFSELLIKVQAVGQKSDADLAALRIEKWKTEAASKQQAQAELLSIRRNLTNAVPDLLEKVQAAPASLNANFRLYRNFNALFDTFSSLTESAGAFGSKDQYTALAADIALVDQVRRQLADRVDSLASANDSELLRLRTQLAAAVKPAPAASKIVVDDDQPKPKKKAKSQPQAPHQ